MEVALLLDPWKNGWCNALENANQVTQQIIALQADECKQAELEEWLDQLRTEVEDGVDKVDE